MATINDINQKLIDSLYYALSEIDKVALKKHIKTTETDYDNETHKPSLEKVTDKDEIIIEKSVPDVAELKILTEQIIRLNDALNGVSHEDEGTANTGVVILSEEKS